MEADELAEVAEKAHGKSERVVGLTMAVFAALLAATTLMGHRLHTEEVVKQTKAVDGWSYYQAKNGRYHMYAADAQLATLIGPQGAATSAEWAKKAQEEKEQSEEIRKESEALDRETEAVARRATFFDAAEISLEVAIVLCSITLLTGLRNFWLTSFLLAIAGIALATMGFR
jgi:hypothetical protein